MADLNKNISQSNDMPDYGQEQLVQAIEEKTEEAKTEIQDAVDTAKTSIKEYALEEFKVRLRGSDQSVNISPASRNLDTSVDTNLSRLKTEYKIALTKATTLANLVIESGLIKIEDPDKLNDTNKLYLVQYLLTEAREAFYSQINDISQTNRDLWKNFSQIVSDADSIVKVIQAVFESGVRDINLNSVSSVYNPYSKQLNRISLNQDEYKIDDASVDIILNVVAPLQQQAARVATLVQQLQDFFPNKGVFELFGRSSDGLFQTLSQSEIEGLQASGDLSKDISASSINATVNSINQEQIELNRASDTFKKYLEFITDPQKFVNSFLDKLGESLPPEALENQKTKDILGNILSQLDPSKLNLAEPMKEFNRISENASTAQLVASLAAASPELKSIQANAQDLRTAKLAEEYLGKLSDIIDNFYNMSIQDIVKEASKIFSFTQNPSQLSDAEKQIENNIVNNPDAYYLPPELSILARGRQENPEIYDEAKRRLGPNLRTHYQEARDRRSYNKLRSNKIREYTRYVESQNNVLSVPYIRPAVERFDDDRTLAPEDFKALSNSLKLSDTQLKEISNAWKSKMGPLLTVLDKLDLTKFGQQYYGIQNQIKEGNQTGNYIYGEFGLELFSSTSKLIADNYDDIVNAINKRKSLVPDLSDVNKKVLDISQRLPSGAVSVLQGILDKLNKDIQNPVLLNNGTVSQDLTTLLSNLDKFLELIGDRDLRDIKFEDRPALLSALKSLTSSQEYPSSTIQSLIDKLDKEQADLQPEVDFGAEVIEAIQESAEDSKQQSDMLDDPFGGSPDNTEESEDPFSADSIEVNIKGDSDPFTDAPTVDQIDSNPDQNQEQDQIKLNLLDETSIDEFDKAISIAGKEIAKEKDKIIKDIYKIYDSGSQSTLNAIQRSGKKELVNRPTYDTLISKSVEGLKEFYASLRQAIAAGLGSAASNPNKLGLMDEIQKYRKELSLSESQIDALKLPQKQAYRGNVNTATSYQLSSWLKELKSLYRTLNSDETAKEDDGKYEYTLNKSLSRVLRASLDLDKYVEDYSRYTGKSDTPDNQFDQIYKTLTQLKSDIQDALDGKSTVKVDDIRQRLYNLNTDLRKAANQVTLAKRESSRTSSDLQQEKYFQQLRGVSEDIRKLTSDIRQYSGSPEIDLEAISQIRKSFAKIWDDVYAKKPSYEIELELAKAKGQLQQLQIYARKLKEEFKETPSVLERIQSKLDAISSGLQRVTSTLSSVTNIGRSMQGFFSNIWRGFTSGISKVANFSKSILTANRATRSLTNTWTELNSKLAIFQRAYQAVFNNQYVTTAQSLMASLAGLNQISKDTANQIVSVALKMEEAWGQSAASIIDSTSQIAIQLKSLGVQNEALANTSLMLSTIGMDMANRGLQGGDYQAIMNKIASGLRGETEAIIDVGVDVRASSLNELLKQIKRAPEQFGLTSEAVANLADNTSSLSETQLVYLRIFKIYQQQMQSYGTILGNLNSFMDTSVGRMAALRNAATTLFSTLGRALYEIVASIAPYIEYIIRLITAMINKFTAWLSQFSIFAEVSNSIAQANQNIGSAFDNTTGSIENNTEATQENTAATTQGSLASFDRIESLDSQSSALDAEADLSGLLDAIPNIQDLIDSAIEGESRVEQLGDKFKEAANDLRSAVEDWLSKTTGRKIDITFGMDFAKISALLSFIGKKLYDTLKNVFGALAAYLAAVFDDIQIGKFLQNILTIIAILLTAINSFSQGLLGSVFGAVAPEGLKSFTQSLDDFITKNEYDQIFKQEAILDEQGNPVLDAEGNPLTRTVIDESKIPTFDQFFEDLAESYPKLATFFTNLATFFRQLADTAGALANALAPLIPQLITFASETLLPKLTEYLQIAGDWISNNTDKIQDFLTRLGEWGWETLQTVIEGIGKAIAYVIENPDTLFSVLDGISNVVGTVLSNPALSTFLGGLILFQDPLDALGESSELAFDGISTLLTGIQMLSNIKLGGLFGAGAASAGAASAGAAGAAGAAGTGAAGAAAAIPVIGIVVAAILSIITALTSNEELFNRLKDAFGRLFEAVGNLNEAMSPVTDVLWKIIETVGTVLVNILIILADAIANIINFFGSLTDIFIGFITFDKDRITKGIEGLFNSISDFFTQGFQDIVKLFSDLLDNIIGIFKKKDQEVDLENYDYDTNMMLIDSRADGDHWSDEYKQQVIDEYHQKFGNDKVDSDEFMKWLTVEHATGGIFDQAHFAQVAEDGPEAIIPLSSKYRNRALAIYGAAGHMLFGSSAMDITSQINSMTAIKSVPSIGSLNSNPAVSGVPPISEDDLFETIVNAIEAGGSGLINKLLALGLLGSKGTGASQVPESQLLMQLAKLLAPYFVANASNIANTSFSM